MAVSVIVPTWNEADHIRATLASLRRHQPAEILVVDGGSSDATVALAAEADRVLLGPRGRARQMNLGASQARGDWLLFLHADCRLEAGALREAEGWLKRRSSVAGCFRMEVAASGWRYRLIAAAATARVRLTGLAYGDQGLLVRHDVFDRLGGFPPLAFLEDVYLSRSLRTVGRVAVLPGKIYVSPRRWQRVGLVRQTLRNWTLVGLAAAGVPADRLAAYYPAVR